MGEPRIDRLTPSDLPRCAELEARLFAADSPWPLAGFVAELRAEHNRYFAARSDDGTLVGYAGVSVLGPVDDRECEVHTIAVDPAYQGHGHGRALLAALLDVADSERADVFLEVRTDNAPAIGLYERNGFTVAGTRRNYYQPSGADAFTMVRRPAGTQPEKGAHP